MLRAVVDANIWVSAMLNRSGAPAQVRDALVNGRFTLITSEPLLAELADVLARPHIARKYGITTADTAELIAAKRRIAEIIPVVGDLRLCRDPDDDVVIETAILGRADVLVTRDDDLKAAPEVLDVLASVGIRVVTVRHFLSSLNEDTTPDGQRTALDE